MAKKMKISDDEKSVFLQSLEKSGDQKPPPAKKPRRKMSAIALFATTFLLFLVIVVFLIFVMSVGGPGNPILQFFGQNEDSVKDFLLSVVNGSFGFLSVILLMVAAVAFFLAFSTPSENAARRRGHFLLAGVSVGLQFLTAFVWLGMHGFVNAMAVAPGSEGGKIVLILPDGKKLVPPISPDETKNLAVPVDLVFSLEKVEKAIRSRGGKIKNISWDFSGTGVFDAPTTARTRNQRFFKAGRHEITAKITLEKGNEVLKKIIFEIPRGTFLARPDRGAAPLDVEFDATAIATPIAGAEKFEWDFDGDFLPDEVSTIPTISHRFSQIGNYKIHLNIVARDGQVFRFSREISVTEPSEDFLIPKISTVPPLKNDTVTIEKGEKVFFDAGDSRSKSGKIIKFQWKISDGTIQKGESFSRLFSEKGKFQIQLSVFDDAGNERKKTVFVDVVDQKSAPTIKVKTDPPAKNGKIVGDTPLAVTFDAEKSDGKIISFEWDFDGDGKIDATGSRVENTFRQSGKFETILTVTDADGNRLSKNFFVETGKQKLTAKILANPETAEMPCEIDFDGSLSRCFSENCEISAYEWDFGDGLGRQLTGAHVPHRFSQIGKYLVTLTVFTNDGQSATATKNVFCRETPLKACFSPSRTRGSSPMTVTFDPSCSAGTVQKWAWDFGDGALSEAVSPTHIFQKPGKYTTTLRVIDDKNNVAKYAIDLVAE